MHQKCFLKHLVDLSATLNVICHRSTVYLEFSVFTLIFRYSSMLIRGMPLRLHALKMEHT